MSPNALARYVDVPVTARCLVSANDNLTPMQVLELHSNRVQLRAELSCDDLDPQAINLLRGELESIEALLKAHEPLPRPRLYTVR